MTRGQLAALCAVWMGTCVLGCNGAAPGDEPEVLVVNDDGKTDSPTASDGRTYHLRRDAARVLRKLRVDEAAPPLGSLTVDPATLARRFLRRNSAVFRLTSDTGELRLDGSAEGSVDFTQLLGGRPLFGAGVRVDIDDEGAIAMVHNRTVAGLVAPTTPPVLTEPQAAAVAASLGLDPDTRELGWALDRAGAPLAVWRVGSERGHVLVDAGTGAVVWRDDLRREATGRGSVYSENTWVDPHAMEVSLPGLAANGTLSGPKVVVAPAAGEAANGKSSHYVFDYPPGSARFGQVMAYHHVDGVARWLASLGISGRKTAIPIRTAAFAELNAYFDPRADGIFLGATPDFDAADDGDVIVHEYGHAVVHAYQPGLLGGSGAPAAGDSAIHEAYGDLLSCVYFGNPASSEALHLAIYKLGLAPDYLRKISFYSRSPGRPCNWGTGTARDLDVDPHVTGLIVSGAFWDLRTALTRAHGAAGTTTANKLAFGALAHLARSNNDFVDVLDAVLETDCRMRGSNAAAIKAAFAAHGISVLTYLDPHAALPWLR